MAYYLWKFQMEGFPKNVRSLQRSQNLNYVASCCQTDTRRGQSSGSIFLLLTWCLTRKSWEAMASQTKCFWVSFVHKDMLIRLGLLTLSNGVVSVIYYYHRWFNHLILWVFVAEVFSYQWTKRSTVTVDLMSNCGWSRHPLHWYTIRRCSTLLECNFIDVCSVLVYLMW